ncbi:MAG: hypothetical protein H7235_06345 [Bdellovibrionaceae bacterium]|nr:hypothetical protein [Pseudobdellovibrionaceae bacterium]
MTELSERRMQIIFLITVAFSSLSHGWGAKGHQIVAFVGAQTASEGPAFWQSNAESLRILSTVPDRVWKAAATKPQEAPTHWFQADAYYKPTEFNQIILFPQIYSDAVNQYGESVIVKNGTAPWRIRQMYALALQAFRAHDMQSGLEYIGSMTHYIGDLSQPLHVSENYDGVTTGDKGIHSFFETKNIVDELAIRADVLIRTENLLKDTNFLAQFSGSLMDIILLEIERSIALRDTVINNDLQLGRTQKGAAIQLELAKDRMADGAATLSMVLNRFWKEAGLVENTSPIAVQDPAWIAPDYSHSSAYSTNDEDDCNQ